MSLPDVQVNILNGALGSVADSPDGVAAMTLSGVATAQMPLATPKVIYSLPDAEALGITADGDNAAAYRHIKEFFAGYKYITGSEKAELWIMTVANTVTFTQIADTTNTINAGKLLDAARGRVRLLGMARTPDASYEPVLTDGIDADCLTAIAKAHDLGNTYATKEQPIRVLIEAREFAAANIGDLKDLTTYSCNRAGLVMWSTLNDGSASVGYQLGIVAGLPVQRKVSRVKNGMLPENDIYIGDARPETIAGLGTIHDKGYQIARVLPNKAGYYLNWDPMCALLTDDYCTLSNGRVIDKAHRITYDTYANELSEEIEVDPTTGKIAAGYIAYMRNLIDNAVTLGMAGNISGFIVTIDANQNVLATNKVVIQEKVAPVGYNKQLEVNLGFNNPQNNIS